MKKALSLALALAMCLGLTLPAFANEGTTTTDKAYKDLDPRTEIYTVTKTPGADYPYYGAKNEPKGGVWYGRTTLGGTLSNGSYGLINQGHMANESAVSFYHGLNNGYTLDFWSYMYGPALADNTRAFLLYINFEHEGADCVPVVNGAYDSNLNEIFDCLNRMSCPVFVRVGGEMNVWSNQATPEQYIAAYRHIVDLARSRAPRASMVFAPNYSGGWMMDMDDYYPGDQYVDWVGCSLYYNHYHQSGDTEHDAFYGVGIYGDALLNVQQTVNLSRLHKKPIILTEGGSGNRFRGADDSAWAAERMDRAYSFLTMVYPEIKCIIASDYTDTYTFYNNSTVTSAYRKAIAANPTFVHDYHDTGSYYTKLSAYTGGWTGSMSLAAYTWAFDKQTAVWTVDGKTFATCTDYPYAATLDTASLASGNHTLTVTFSNGATKSYTFQTVEAPTYAGNGAQVSKWAQDRVTLAVNTGLAAEGLGNDYRVNITRAQFAATAVKLYEAMGGKVDPAGENPFNDTTDPVIIQASELGFVSGVGGGRFSPNALVTREQAALMLTNVYVKLGGSVPTVDATTFADNASVSGWARSAVAFMSGNGIVSGVGNNNFGPQGNASIEQALLIALKMFENLK